MPLNANVQSITATWIQTLGPLPLPLPLPNFGHWVPLLWNRPRPGPPRMGPKGGRGGAFVVVAGRAVVDVFVEVRRVVGFGGAMVTATLLVGTAVVVDLVGARIVVGSMAGKVAMSVGFMAVRLVEVGVTVGEMIAVGSMAEKVGKSTGLIAVTLVGAGAMMAVGSMAGNVLKTGAAVALVAVEVEPEPKLETTAGPGIL